MFVCRVEFGLAGGRGRTGVCVVFQAEGGVRDSVASRGVGDVYKI